MVITFALPENPDAAVIEITDYIHTLLDELRTNHQDIDYYLTGNVVLNRAFGETTKDDTEKLTPVVFLVILVVTAVLLRSAFGTLATMLLVMFTVNTTAGFAGWIGTVFTPINAGVPIIVMTIAVADSIHVITAALAGLGRGLDKNQAIIESVRSNAWPVFLTSATTAAGFLTLNSSDSPPFHVLGNLVAFGVLWAFIYSMTLLPGLAVNPAVTRAPGSAPNAPVSSTASAHSSSSAAHSCFASSRCWQLPWPQAFPATS